MRFVLLAILVFGAVGGGVAQTLPATNPPLPEGAYPEWDIGKAWQQNSPKRAKICLNGLWRFRSEPRLAEMEVVETYFVDDFEGETLEGWSVNEVPGGLVRATLDRTQKTHGNASMKVELDIPPNANFYHVTRLAEVPTGVKLTLRMDVRAEMERGEMHVELQDARDFKIYTLVGGKFANLPKWKTIECDFVMPPGSNRLKILVPRNHGYPPGCKGTVWIDNLRIVKVDCLAAPGITPPVDDHWGYLKVPGSWNSQHWSWRGKVYWHPEDTERTRSADLRFGWYERELTVPRNWRGRRILVQLDRVSTDVRLYCDGVETGSVGYMGGDIDITRFAQPGKALKLSLLVQARDGWNILPGLLTKPSKAWRGKLPLMGIAGDVFLTSEPGAGTVRLGRSRVVTSVKKQEIRVVAELIAPTAQQVPAGLVLRCEVRDQGNVAKHFETPVAVGAAEALCTSQWTNPKLWDIGKPHLYTLHMTLMQNGRAVDESLPERFGFREFEIRGKFFYLNEVKLNLVPSSYCGTKAGWTTQDAMRHWVKGARKAGYNFVYLGEADRPGKPEIASHLLEVCDELGMLAAVSPLGVNRSICKEIDKPEIWKPWAEVARKRVRKDWNHPSLVLWRMNMNLNCYKQDQNPLVLDGKMEFEPGSASAIKETAMLKSNAFVRSLDPTRSTYNHACGKTGEIYNLNNYLGWPELQDLREWLRVWAENGDKPMYMAEQATPYPGDFQMRDPRNWWTNEPVMTEYGAILLGERSYLLEEHDYVGYYDAAWDGKGRRWRSSYGYFCHAYPPILDECSSRYYEAMLPAWRTWGISGGVNAWENTWRRLIKRQEESVLRKGIPDLPLETDWENLQRPGFSADVWQYAAGGGGEIRCLFDLGRPEEKEHIEPTLRAKVMPELIKAMYAYIAGPGDEWFAQDHAFYAGETIAKSVVLLNDLRQKTSFAVRWQAEADGKILAQGAESTTVNPAESARVPFRFQASQVQTRTDVRITVDVVANGQAVPVKPFALQIHPHERSPEGKTLSDWAVFDPTGKTTDAFRKAGLRVKSVDAKDDLPSTARVLVIGCNGLGDVAEAKFASILPQRCAAGLQVLVFEQTAEVLEKTFALRCFTPGVRRAWIRDAVHPILSGLGNDDLTDWRGATTLGPLDAPPQSLDEVQRWKRVWRCSQLGVVASVIAEKPHLSSFRPLLDTGFDLRYTPLWEVAEGKGRMVFCLLDVTDRIGLDPAADNLLRNLIEDLNAWENPTLRTVQMVAESANAPLSGMALDQSSPPPEGAGKIIVLPRGCAAWLSRNATAIRPFLATGGRILAAGLAQDEAEILASSVGDIFSVETNERWLNPLSEKLPAAFRGVSPAGVHWRRKLTVQTVSSIPANGWRVETGVLATIPVGAGEIVWISALPEDFDPAQRPDLVHTRVNTERLYSIVLANLGAQIGPSWLTCLGAATANVTEARFYTDQRTPRDDPYADMRW